MQKWLKIGFTYPLTDPDFEFSNQLPIICIPASQFESSCLKIHLLEGLLAQESMEFGLNKLSVVGLKTHPLRIDSDQSTVPQRTRHPACLIIESF